MKSEEFYQKYLQVEQEEDSENTKQEMTEKELQNWLMIFNQAKNS